MKYFQVFGLLFCWLPFELKFVVLAINLNEKLECGLINLVFIIFIISIFGKKKIIISIYLHKKILYIGFICFFNILLPKYWFESFL